MRLLEPRHGLLLTCASSMALRRDLEKEVDLTDAKQMLQRANQAMEQYHSYNKALAAQLRVDDGGSRANRANTRTRA